MIIQTLKNSGHKNIIIDPIDEYNQVIKQMNINKKEGSKNDNEESV